MENDLTLNDTTSDAMVVDGESAPVLETAQSAPEKPSEQAQIEIEKLPIDAATSEPILSADTPTQEARSEAAAPPPQPTDTIPTEGDEPNEEEHPEWEIDSSPIESSSGDSSDDSSSEDSDEEGENSYKLLSPEEQARILMQGDGGSDDEDGGNKAKGSGTQLRTKNEIPEEVIPKPDVTITPEMPIEELGTVEAVVENNLLIKAKTSGEYRVLESGSVLCLADRTVIGAVAETFGRVQEPLYSVRFTNATEISDAGLEVGTKIFYSEQHSTYVFTQALKAFKGSDASNMHDEEVGDEEIEFSDDEAEMEHKRKLKQRRVEKRGGKAQQGGAPNRGPHPLKQEHNGNSGLNYEDGEDDGPYRPLTRPSGFGDTATFGEAPVEAPPGASGRANYNVRNNETFRGRGRGDRGRGRGDRARGRGDYRDRRGDSSGYSLPPQSHQNGYYGQSGQHFPQPPMLNAQAGYPQQQVPPTNFTGPSPSEYSPQQPLLWPQFPQQNPYQQSYQQAFQGMQQGPWPNMPQGAPLPTGAFINPAFFPGGQAGPAPQMGQQGQQPPQQSPQAPGNGAPGN